MVVQTRDGTRPVQFDQRADEPRQRDTTTAQPIPTQISPRGRRWDGDAGAVGGAHDAGGVAGGGQLVGA